MTTMRKLADGRVVYIATNSVDPYVDANLLADCVAAIDTDEVSLWNVDGRPMMLDGGTLRPINRERLHELAERFVVVPRLVFTGNGDETAIRYAPYEINEMEIRNLLTAKSAAGGGLIFRLPGPLEMPVARPVTAAPAAPTQDEHVAQV